MAYPYSGLGILDLTTSLFTPIPRPIIRYPSDGIMRWQIAFTPDGSQVYWQDVGGEEPAIYRSQIDGSGLTKIGELPGGFSVEFSPDLTAIAYVVFDEQARALSLQASNIDGSGAVEIDKTPDIGTGGIFSHSWRPLP